VLPCTDTERDAVRCCAARRYQWADLIVISMKLFRTPPGTPDVEQPKAMRALYGVLALLSLVPLAILLPRTSTATGIAILAGWIALLWISISFVRGQFYYIPLMWVAVYPYCYYYVSFYVKRPILTVDRAFILLLILEMFVVSRHPFVASLTRDMRISGYFWGLYLLVCCVSLAGHTLTQVLSSSRLLVDGMVIPPLLGLYAARYFPLLKNIQKLHLCACILGLGLCISGLIELTTGIDLFPYGQEPLFTDTHIRRADGPFEQHIVLSMVAILTFFFVIYLRRLMPHVISPWRALFHRAATMASLGAALLPLDRGLVLALVPIAIIDCCSRQRLISRRLWAAFFGLILLTVITARLLEPRLYEERVSRPDNFYQRLAQDQETLRVVRAYPLFGVGFGLYHDVAAQDPRYLARWKGIESMNLPHNALMTVLSEDGIIGLLFYVLAQAFFIRAMWRLRKAYPPGWLAFLYCFLVYALIGLDFGTVYFSDINLFFIFVLGIFFQMQLRLAREQEVTLVVP
jgi:O-Antigen ligase